eukprot:TRINITY_DN12216_c0_g1_i1.p1 TRINITY_DN12216_c0_g1~~TRINITY_DN12216_c0_g1_i1.p1  ORF type:complete len:289 (-),score=30.58 TRINITY_DN12216_c0_g1_i1:280-1146(-)
MPDTMASDTTLALCSEHPSALQLYQPGKVTTLNTLTKYNDKVVCFAEPGIPLGSLTQVIVDKAVENHHDWILAQPSPLVVVVVGTPTEQDSKHDVFLFTVDLKTEDDMGIFSELVRQVVGTPPPTNGGLLNIARRSVVNVEVWQKPGSPSVVRQTHSLQGESYPFIIVSWKTMISTLQQQVDEELSSQYPAIFPNNMGQFPAREVWPDKEALEGYHNERADRLKVSGRASRIAELKERARQQAAQARERVGPLIKQLEDEGISPREKLRAELKEAGVVDLQSSDTDFL